MLVLTSVAALVALAASGIGTPGRIMLAAVVLLVGVRAWSRQSRWTGAFLRLRRDGTAEWQRSRREGEQTGRLVAHWHAGPLVALVLASADGRPRHERLALWRDQVDPEAWRRLLILLRHDRRGDGAIG